MKGPPRGLYRRKRRDGTEGATWWCWYWDATRRRTIQESTGTADLEEAERFLRARQAEHPRARRQRRAGETVTVRDALDLYRLARADEGRGVHEAMWRGLDARLGAVCLSDLTRAHLDAVCRAWRRDGIDYEARDERRNPRHPVSTSTCNRGMTMLRRGRNLAVEKLGITLPTLTFSHFKERARGRPIPPETFARILGATRDPIVRDFFELCYRMGVRSGQLKRTELRNVRVTGGAVTALVYEAEQTKQERPHTVPLVGRAQEIVQARWEARRLDCAWLFHRDGKPLGELKSEWRRACVAAGMTVGRKAGGFVLYNCRHSALTNLAEAGVPDVTGREISGHRTASVHGRYVITGEAAKRSALEKIDRLLPTADTLQTQPSPGDATAIRKQRKS